MKTESSKVWDNSAQAYANMAADRKQDAYEYDINFPSILSLIGDKKGSLLDVGTGSGDFIPVLENKFDEIEGTDVSPNMVDIAQKNFPQYSFKVWDLEEKYDSDKKFDVILCKLVLMFVEDLDNVAKEFYRLLNDDGFAVISVIHPLYWHHNYILDKFGIDPSPEFSTLDQGYYSKNKKITKLIGGNKELKIGFTHRTIQDYIQPFTNNNLAITGLEEPKITQELLKENPRFEDRLNIPMRLNFRIAKIK